MTTATPGTSGAYTAPALTIRQLHKHYGSHRALDGVDLTVSAGEVYGLLGPNGAGKTTLMKALLGLQRPTSGSIQIFGRPVGRESLADVGALIEVPGLWPTLTADETLKVHAKLRGVPPGVDRTGAAPGQDDRRAGPEGRRVLTRHALATGDRRRTAGQAAADRP